MSQRRTYWEAFCLPLLIRRPFRCGECQHRFYGFSFDAGTRARMRMSLLVLLALIGLAWGIWKAVDTVVSGVTSPTPSKPRGPGRPR